MVSRDVHPIDINRAPEPDYGLCDIVELEYLLIFDSLHQCRIWLALDRYAPSLNIVESIVDSDGVEGIRCVEPAIHRRAGLS